jgi:hypothetical protein
MMSRLTAILTAKRVQTLFWGAVFLLVAGAIQWQIPFPMDGDTAFHAAVGRLIREHGILYSFPWTTFSWLADNYADMDLFFHLLFVPFIGLGWVTASQIVGTLCGAAILLTIYLILQREGVAYPWLWALILLASSHLFIYRFALVRPHLVSITLALIVLWAATSGQLRYLAIASVLYPLFYVAWHLPVILVAIAECANLLSGRRIGWKPALTAVAGITAGIAVHPHTVNLVRLFRIQIFEVLFRTAWGAKEGFDLGLEFFPETVDGWLNGLLLCVFMTIAALALAWKARRERVLPLAFALTTLAFAVLTAKSGRFLEYFVPFSVVSLALTAHAVRWRFLPQTLLVAASVYTLGLNHRFIRSFADSPDCMPESVVTFLQEKIPPGSQVFTPDWSSTGGLMLALPDRRFIVAQDPTFFYIKDPALYRLWYKIAHEAPPDSVDQVRHSFSSRYVISFYPNKIIPQEWSPFLERFSSDPRVKTYIIDDMSVLFDLGPLENTAAKKIGGNKN